MEQKKTNVWMILAIVFGAFMVLLFFVAAFFGFAYIGADQNYQDQQEVTQKFVEAYDALANYEFDRSADFLEEAQELQMEIFDRNGMEYSE